jgi:hypothetical protein
MMNAITQHVVHEWSFVSARRTADPFNEIELEAVFTGEDGKPLPVPAFWAGGDLWRVRFSSPVTGRFTYRTVCTDAADPGLHGQTGEFTVVPYTGDNPLFRHGPVRIAADGRHFEHADGTPFLWLADTWWMGFCARLGWPRAFQELALDRVEKGFNVIQIVAGLYPDMPGFDERSRNEAGCSWEPEYGRINPAYFDYADRRIAYMVDAGLMPCIVGCWGYYLKLMGIAKTKQHWRYLVARYGAYPVFWCLAGEQVMPFYLAEDKKADEAFQEKGWSEVTAYVKSIDPFGRLRTVHPGKDGREQMTPPTLIDFEMLQTGHGDRQSLPNTVESVIRSVKREPVMPVIDSEVCYEGIGEACRQEVQRLMFWTCMLNGAAGHTYGANGIWQLNTRAKPYGPSPHGLAWGNTPWDEAYRLPGSAHVALGKRLLERYPWWEFRSHPEWVENHWTKENYFGAYAAGVPGRVRVIFWPATFGSSPVKGIEPGVEYRAFLFNPATGDETDLGKVVPDSQATWQIPVGEGTWRVMPIYQDWVLVLES